MQGVFNPNILIYHPPNSAEGFHFSAFHYNCYNYSQMDHTTKVSGSNVLTKNLMQKEGETRDVNKSNTIIVEEYKSKHKDPTIWIPELQLSSCD